MASVKPSASKSSITPEVRPSAHKSSNQAKVRFLMHLSKGNTVTESARAGGMHRRTYYDWRDQDLGFANDWDAAISESVEVLEAEVRTRALDKSDKASHLLLMFLLKKHDPTYRENYKREVHITHEKVQEFSFSADEMDDAIGILTRERDKSKPPSEET